VLGVAVLATVFSSNGGMVSPQAYVDGLVPAVWVGAAVLAVGALVALLIPRRTGADTAGIAEPVAQEIPCPVLAEAHAA
jgi:cytochrome c biogenesis factor